MSDTANKLSKEAFELALPRNYYKLRCIEAEDDKTTKGFKMIKLKLEIIPRTPGEPTIVKGVCVDGLNLYANSVVTEKSIEFHNKIRAAFGLNRLEKDEIEQAVALSFRGAECFALCQGSNEPDKDGEGNQIKDPYTGETRMVNRREVVEFAPRPTEQ